MDDDEFAALRQQLLDAVVTADRANGLVRDLAHQYRLEEERRIAPVIELRPEDPEDDDELDGLRAAHRDWHIWRNSEGWHAVKNAHSDPVTEPTAAALDRRLGPDAT